MAAENSEAWYINDAASCTTPEAFVGLHLSEMAYLKKLPSSKDKP
jgi:hypothetical protein